MKPSTPTPAAARLLLAMDDLLAGLLQHHAGESIHSRGSCGSSRSHHFFPDGIHGANVVDDAVGEIDAFG